MKSEKVESEKTESKKTKSNFGFDTLLLVFVAVLFVVSVASAVQLNGLNEKVVSFQQSVSYQQVSPSDSSSGGSKVSLSDQEILDNLSNAPDMVGGC